MLLNVVKCRVKNFGYNDNLARYYIGNTVLPTYTIQQYFSLQAFNTNTRI